MPHPIRLSAAFGLAFSLAAVSPLAAAPAPARKAAPAAAPSWVMDKAASRLRFRSAFAGTAFEGGFSRFDAQINFDPKNLAASRAVVSVDLASAATGDADRDQTLPTADWFNTAKFPRATFTTTSIRDLGGGRYQAQGALSLKGVTRPVTLPFTLQIQGNVARMNGQLAIDRSQFGVGQGQFAGADAIPHPVTVTVAVVARRG